MQNKRTFILDTSVLLYNASSMRSFGSKNVVIPYPVLEELDKFKTREGEVGKNARQVVRELNELRKEGSLCDGVVVTPKGGILTVALCERESGWKNLDFNLADDRILSIALQLKESSGQRPAMPEVVLVTKDINLAVKAEALGLEARDFSSDKLVESASDLYKGVLEAKITSEMIDAICAGEKIYTSDISDFIEKDIYVNQYMTLSALENPGKTILARAGDLDQPIKKLKSERPHWGVVPRNREQHFALDALMDPDIPLVTLMGRAGSGKSLLSLACALEQVHDLKTYDRLVVSRPVQPMGNDIGYLPGSLEEKLSPWMGPLRDSISFLTKSNDRGNSMYEHMIETGMLEIEALTYIRGRSMPNTLFLLDEAQDLTRPEIKTIISRMGENSKLIITGDVMQISNPYLDPTNTGLASVVERFKTYKVAAHVTLERGERSTLATIASEIL